MGGQPSQPLHESESASTWLKDTVTGSHRFKIEGYSYDKGMGVGKFATSSTFVVGGYEWVIRYYPDGSTNSSFLTFALGLIKSGAKEVKARVGFTILDQRDTPSRWKASGLCTFGATTPPNNEFRIKREELEASDCLINDSFTIMITVTIVQHCRTEVAKLKPAAVPPSDLNQHLLYLLERGDGADVTFKVRGETLIAHKCVLAARSPFFRALFFGPLKEKQGECINVDEIEPPVFRAFLHFIYSDSVSELDEKDDLTMYQHLLVAADRYEVKRLKLICEYKLSQNIELNNLAINLTLAEQHMCPQLKASCFKFVSSPKILASVMGTDGFEHLTRTCPAILKELVENTSNYK